MEALVTAEVVEAVEAAHAHGARPRPSREPCRYGCMEAFPRDSFAAKNSKPTVRVDKQKSLKKIYSFLLHALISGSN